MTEDWQAFCLFVALLLGVGGCCLWLGHRVKPRRSKAGEVLGWNKEDSFEDWSGHSADDSD